MTMKRILSRKVSSLKLLVGFPISSLEGMASIMSWDNQVFAEKSRDLVSKRKNASKTIQSIKKSSSCFEWIFVVSHMKEVESSMRSYSRKDKVICEDR